MEEEEVKVEEEEAITWRNGVVVRRTRQRVERALCLIEGESERNVHEVLGVEAQVVIAAKRRQRGGLQRDQQREQLRHARGHHRLPTHHSHLHPWHHPHPHSWQASPFTLSFPPSLNRHSCAACRHYSSAGITREPEL